MPGSLKIVGLLYLGVASFIAFIGLVLGFFNLPLQPFTRRGLGPTVFLGLSILELWLGWRYFNALSASNSIGFSDYRASAILVVVSLLLFALVRINQGPPLLSSLLRIRRELAFGMIEVEDAFARADIAITGLRVSDLLQDNIREVLEALDRQDVMERDVIERYGKIKNDYLAEPPSSPNLKELDEIVKEIGACIEILELSMKDFKAERKSFDRLLRWLNWIATLAPDAKQDIGEVFTSVEQGLHRVETKRRQQREEFDGIRTGVDAAYQRIENEVNKINVRQKEIEATIEAGRDQPK